MSRLARHLLADLLRVRRAARRPSPEISPLRPFKLTLVVTERCHHRCRLCRLWASDPAPGPTLEQLDRLFTVNPDFSWINLTGGELVARDDIEEILTRMLAAQRRLELLQFPTAGWRPARTERLIRFLLGQRLPRLVVTVSIDGDRKTHDRLRGRPGAWDRAVETLARLRTIRDPRFRVMAGITLSSCNESVVESALDELCTAPLALPRRSIHVNVAHRSAHAYRNTASPAEAPTALPYAPLRLATLVRPTRIIEALYRRLAPYYLATGRCPVPCRATAASIFIAADLQVYPCSTWSASLGDLESADFDLRRLLSTAQARALHRRILEQSCPGCWTPCDAAPTLAVGLPEALRAAWRRKRPGPIPAIDTVTNDRPRGSQSVPSRSGVAASRDPIPITGEPPA